MKISYRQKAESPSTLLANNQIFGYQVLPGDGPSTDIVFSGALPVEQPSSGAWGAHLFASPHTSLQSFFSNQQEICTYVWGIPAHPDVGPSNISEWCANVVAAEQYTRFQELLGPFVVIVDQPRKHRLTFVSDILGIRPLFLGRYNGRIVFGSEVWPLQAARLTEGKANYDAVSAWIAYGYNCTSGSLFEDLHRLPPGSAVVFQHGRRSEITYAKFEPGAEPVSAERVARDVHAMVSAAVRVLLTSQERVSLALSGGYDSRYLLALSSSYRTTSLRCATVDFTPQEGRIASQVAETLESPLDHISVNSSVWDLYDEPYHFTPDGFPISKFVTNCIACQHGGLPLINGFMGDSLIRGSNDQFLGKYETEWASDLASVLVRKHTATGFEMFRQDIAKRIHDRAFTPMEVAVHQGSQIGKVFGWADFYYRQRYYISNNFLQHLGLAESLLPFYTWPLLSYKMEHDYRSFSSGVYSHIFRMHFPALAQIPHAADLSCGRESQPRAACVKRWALQLLPIVHRQRYLSLLTKSWSLPRIIAGAANMRRVEGTILTLQRLYLLEKRATDAGLNFDWNSI